MGELKEVYEASQFCKVSGLHQLCRCVWTTPSSRVTCTCECHAVVDEPHVITPKGPRAQQRVLTPKH